MEHTWGRRGGVQEGLEGEGGAQGGRPPLRGVPDTRAVAGMLVCPLR